jgi:hypothetical protein
VNVTPPKFVTLSLFKNAWYTHDNNSLDDAMSEDAQVILRFCNWASGIVKTKAGFWKTVSYAAAHEEMRKLQQKFKPMIQNSDPSLNQIMGLGEANASNTPNTPIDPRLMGDSPFEGDDSCWRDYQKDHQ